MRILLKQATREKESRYAAWIEKFNEFYAAPIAEDEDNPGHPANNKVPPRGSLDAPIMVFAGYPDKKSFLAGKALIGSKARDIAKKVGLKEKDLFYAYVIPSFSSKKITSKDIKAYQPLIKDLIWIIKPKYILPLDELAEKFLKGITNIPKLITLKDLEKVKDEFIEKSDSMKREDAWDIIRALPDEVTITKEYVVIPGSLPDKRQEINDIDFHVVDYVFNPSIEDEIKKRVKERWRAKLQFFNNPEKPKGFYLSYL